MNFRNITVQHSLREGDIVRNQVLHQSIFNTASSLKGILISVNSKICRWLAVLVEYLFVILSLNTGDWNVITFDNHSISQGFSDFLSFT